MKRKHWTLIVPGAVLMCTSPAFAVDLREAVQAALNTNPEIRQAVEQRVDSRRSVRRADRIRQHSLDRFARLAAVEACRNKCFR